MNIYTLTGEVLLKGTNEAIEELRRLEEQAESTANKLGKLITNMDANFKASSNITINSLSKVNKSAKTFESDFSKTMNKIGKTLLTVFSAREIIGFAKDVTEASAEVTAEIVAFEQILGGYADTARIKMEEMAKTAGIVSTRLTPHMTNLTAKFKGLGFEMNEATDLAVRGLEMATDAAAFWDFSLEQSMEHLKSFINGNYEGGEAIGLFANETQMAYYGIEKGLIASRKAWIHLDEATKQATRLEFAERMFEQAQITGHAARESQHFANVLANLKESFRQLKASIGDSYLEDALIPAMNSLRNILDDINENVDKFNAWLEDNEVIKHFSELWNQVAIDVSMSLGLIEGQFKKFADWLVNESFLSPVIKPTLLWLSEIWDNFIEACETGNWDLVFGTMSEIKLIPIIGDIIESVEGIINALKTGDWSGIFEGVLKGVSVALTITYAKNGLERAISDIVNFAINNGTLKRVASMGGSLAFAALTIGVKLNKAIEDNDFASFGADIVSGILTGLLAAGITGSVQAGVIAFSIVGNLGIVSLLSQLSEKIWADYAREFKEQSERFGVDPKDVAADLNRISMITQEAGLSAKEKLEKILNTESGREIGTAVLEGMNIALEDLPNISAEQAEKALISVKDVYGIASPSKKAEEIGKFIVQGFEKGLEGTNELGEKVGEELLKGMQNSLEIHSPSEKTILLASYLLDGFQLGLKTIEDLGSEAGQNLFLGMYELIEDETPWEIGRLIAEAVNEGLISNLDGEILNDWLTYIYNNPPSVDKGSSGGTPTPEGETRKNRYNQLTASLEDREGELEAAMTNLYNARADYGFDSDEAKAIESEIAALKKWIAKLKELIDEIENPSTEEDNTIFGKIKQFVTNTEDKIEESKEKYGQYIDWIEDKFSEGADFVMGFVNDVESIELNKLESELSKLEEGMVTLEDGSTSTIKDEEEKLTKQLENKEITYAQFNERMLALEEKNQKEILAKKNELEEKKFNSEKRNKISNAWIDAASGIMKVWAEYATQPWLAGGLTALLTTQAGVQTAAIESQEFVPMLAQGGIVDSATHAIIGEDGREAVVPLERNLEWVNGLARAMSPAISSNALSYTPEMSSIRTEIVELRRMLSEYLPQIIEKDTNLSIDGRILSNAIAPMMDKSLGSISRLKARGV